jgi:hypothetical protein
MARIDMGQPHCGTGEEVAVAGSSSRDTGSCIHKEQDRSADTVDSDYTVSSGPYLAASPAARPADDDRSSCRLGRVLQTNRVLGWVRSCEALR